jgi:ABC-type Mn2+/Zn2+ transport system ATPase subunit
VTAHLVRLAGVDFGYDRQPVLTGVDLAVETGDLIGVVGPSGSGKTSLLRLLLGTVRPQRGAVTRRAGLTVSYVPQLETVNWNFPVTVAECVLMARTGRTLPWPSRAERAEVARLLDRLGIGALGHRHIRELSGGQQQRMFIARALLRAPQLLLLDEPTSGVDVATRHDMLHLLADLNAEGVAILLTTHDLNGVAAHLSRLVALNGAVLATGTPREVITAPVLEATFGAPMDVLEHLGMPVVLDPYQHAPGARGRSSA